jgi:Pyridoxamine 5'-phosphate oxidase
MDMLAGHAEFLATNHAAAMITIAADGTPKPVRVGIALVDGKLWSSGTAGRVRTRRLRRDPRCTLFVFETGGFSWLGLDTTVTVLDGPGAPAANLRLFRVMQGRPTGPLSWFGGELDEDRFLAAMRDEERLIYEFGVHRVYGPG